MLIILVQLLLPQCKYYFIILQTSLLGDASDRTYIDGHSTEKFVVCHTCDIEGDIPVTVDMEIIGAEKYNGNLPKISFSYVKVFLYFILAMFKR